MASGDDIQAGMITAAEKTTDLIAQRPSEGDVDFDGDTIFRVGPQRGGLTRPATTLHAIVGIGWNGDVPVQHSRGGTGVIGIGGPNQGTGVIGRGGGDAAGLGGTGVQGIGGKVEGPSFGLVDPGTGVLGRGGVQDDFDTSARPHGAGVVAVAGGAPLPSFMETGSVGAFGQGGNADRRTVNVDGVTNIAGPQEPGPGVLGKGGIQSEDGRNVGPAGAGMIGVAGGVGAPPFGETRNVGVYGKGGGVKGQSDGGAGVHGHSGTADGVIGISNAENKSGVFGFNSKTEGAAFGVFGRCNSTQGAGVAGTNDGGFGGIGVLGVCNKPVGVGVRGIGNGFGAVGVRAETAAGGIALVAEDIGRSGLAGVFLGDLRVFGLKSAAVPHPDGSHRLLYCVESPESWFEDFGEGQLVDGETEVQLDSDFAALVEVNGYHVFVTPYGESKGLFVTERYATGFRVCEQQAGTSNVSFSYRVVAKRKDIVADRLAMVTPPKVHPQ